MTAAACTAPEFDDAFKPVRATLGRVLRVAPAAAARAERAVAAATAALTRTLWPEALPTFSRLTNTGYPVEFGWSSRDLSVRWTAEAAPPETAHHLRLQRAAEAAGLQFDLQPWADAQRPGDLLYGAWVGGRHSPDVDQAKVYVELTGELPQAWKAAHPLCRSSLITWRMAGLNADASVEIYGRCPDLDKAGLQAAEAAVFGGEGRLLAAVQSLVGQAEPPRPSGLSLSFDAHARAKALTWFVFAKAMFRDDAKVAAALTTATPCTQLQRLHAAFAGGVADGRWRHGMLGLSVDHSGETWVQAGIRPT